MKKLIFISLLSLFIFSGAKTYSQVTTEGKEFWCTFISNTPQGGEAVLTLMISSRYETEGQVFMPKSGFLFPFFVTPDSVTVVPIPVAQGENKGSETIQPRGIHITALDTINVFASSIQQFASDASVVLPVQSIGTEYYIVSDEGAINEVSEFAIAAIYDSTEVEIWPTATTLLGEYPGTSFKVMLNAAETYQVQGDFSAGSHFTGTRVLGTDKCKPFAVFAGNTCSSPGDANDCDHLYEQMYPVEAWGTKYFAAPLRGESKYFIRVVAAADETEVTIDGEVAGVINRGNFLQTHIDSAAIIEADKPIEVGMYCIGTSYGPFLIMLSPEEQSIQEFSFNTPAGNFSEHYLNIVSRTDNIDSVFVDGKNIAASFIPFTTDADFSYARYKLASSGNLGNAHNVKGNRGVLAYAYGFGTDDSYGYAAGASFTNLTLKQEVTGGQCATDPVLFSVTKNLFFNYDSFYWDHGDGTFSTKADHYHAYEEPGIYNVKVVLLDYGSECDEEGVVDSIETTFEVLSKYASSLFGFKEEGTTGIQFWVVDSVTEMTYLWDFGDRTPPSTEKNPYHLYTTPDVYTVTLITTNQCGEDTLVYDIDIDGETDDQPKPKGVGENKPINVHTNVYYDVSLASWKVNSNIEIAGINLFGISGAKLQPKVEINGRDAVISANNVESGTLLFQIIMADGRTVHKRVIKQ